MTEVVTTTLNPIDAIKKECVDFIKRNPYFDNLDVLTDEKGDIETTISLNLQRLGIGIALEIASGKIKFTAVGSQAVDLKAVITIVENVLVNRDEGNSEATGKRAGDCLCELIALFNPLQSAVPLVVSDFDMLSNTGGIITYQINAIVQAGWKQKIGAT